MKVLMDGDPAFVRMLSEQPAGMQENGEKESLYDRVMKQMDRLGRLSDHYRVRKLVMTDAYFLTHYDDEIAIASKNAGSAEREKLSKLLAKSRDTAGMINDVIYGDKVLPPWMTSGSTEVIEALENEHKTRAFAEERLDLSLISKESMKSLLQEIKDFHSRYPGMFVKEQWPLVQQRMKGYSKEFRQMMRQFYMINNVNEIVDEGRKYQPGTYEVLNELRKDHGDDKRLNGYDQHMEFKDPVTGEYCEYSSDMDRDQTYFVHGAEGQMMSSEEILEMYEGLCAAKWKDIDMADPSQVAAAKDMYMRSYADVYRFLVNELQRLMNTYGTLPIQLPAMALIAASYGKYGFCHRFMAGNTVVDMLKQGSYQSSGDKNKTMLDALVENGYLSKEYAEASKKIIDYQTGISFAVNNVFGMFGNYFMNPDDPSEFEYEPAGTKEFVDGINIHRDEVNGPSLTAEEERRCWVLNSAATAETGFAEQAKGQHLSNIHALRSLRNSPVSLARIECAIDTLKGVDTPDHSPEYRTFYAGLDGLVDCYLSILKNNAPDGKNLDPKSLGELNRAYETAIGAARDYLKDKDREHRNPVYRRRYDTVASLITDMDEDYSALKKKSTDKSYGLKEVLG
jgi:hypothetical protein